MVELAIAATSQSCDFYITLHYGYSYSALEFEIDLFDIQILHAPSSPTVSAMSELAGFTMHFVIPGWGKLRKNVLTFLMTFDTFLPINT